MTNHSLAIENCLIQVRSTLQAEGIKLWLEPFYLQDIGPVDSEIEVRNLFFLIINIILPSRHVDFIGF